MPNARNNAKLTGDTHLPDVDEGTADYEDDIPRADDDNDRGAASEGQKDRETPRDASGNRSNGPDGQRPR